MKKKIAGLVCAIASVMLIASCGSSSSGGSAAAEEAAESSIQGFAGAVFTDECGALIDSGTAGECGCSGSGTVTVAVTAAASVTAKDTITAVAANCVDETTDQTFNGTITIDDVTGDATINFTQFGECTYVNGSIQDIGEACSGQIAGTCAGSTYTCNLEDGPDGDCECQ